MESSELILFFITAISLVGLALVFSSYVPPTSFNTAKFEPYECGMETIGETWNQYTVGYYLFAILFLIFDVETVFFFPWATVMKVVGMTGFLGIFHSFSRFGFWFLSICLGCLLTKLLNSIFLIHYSLFRVLYSMCPLLLTNPCHGQTVSYQAVKNCLPETETIPPSQSFLHCRCNIALQGNKDSIHILFLLM